MGRWVGGWGGAESVLCSWWASAGGWDVVVRAHQKKAHGAGRWERRKGKGLCAKARLHRDFVISLGGVQGDIRGWSGGGAGRRWVAAQRV